MLATVWFAAMLDVTTVYPFVVWDPVARVPGSNGQIYRPDVRRLPSG